MRQCEQGTHPKAPVGVPPSVEVNVVEEEACVARRTHAVYGVEGARDLNKRPAGVGGREVGGSNEGVGECEGACAAARGWVCRLRAGQMISG